jgi:cytochrome c-type biogenesis protein
VSIADTFVATVTDGPLLLALPVAAAAGLVSFLSPCVLPLVPGYLSYVTGLSGAEIGDDRRPQPVPAAVAPGGDLRPVAGDTPSGPQAVEDHRAGGEVRRGRVLAGSLLFVAGFSAVFITSGAFFGFLGSALLPHAAIVNRVLGALVVVLGLSFLGLLPQLQRTVKLSWLPNRGLLGAPLLGALFGVGWTPCLGPTLAAVQTLAYNQASAGRGAVLTAAYCVGLGLPFVLTGLAFRRALGAFDVVKRHYRLVMRIGGGLLVVVGLLLLSGLWETAMAEVRGWVDGFETVV